MAVASLEKSVVKISKVRMLPFFARYHFTVVCSVTWPLNGSEAGGDLVLIQTLLLFSCKPSCSNAN